MDDEPWFGLDIAHPNCPLPDNACTLYLDTGLYMTAILRFDEFDCLNHPHKYGYRVNGAKLSIKDETGWKVKNDLHILYLIIKKELAKVDATGAQPFVYNKVLQECPPIYRKLLRELDDAIDQYDLNDLEVFSEALTRIYSEMPSDVFGAKVSFVGHSHLDLVWLWPENVTNKKSVHTYSTMLRLIEKSPEFIFQMSQPYILHEIKKSHPNQYNAICERIQEGRWEATGGFEVEPDTMIPVGEALARCLLLGQERDKEFQGKYTNTLWLPDVFGYNQCLTQICTLGVVICFSLSYIQTATLHF